MSSRSSIWVGESNGKLCYYAAYHRRLSFAHDWISKGKT
jgi:hypothetical protein